MQLDRDLYHHPDLKSIVENTDSKTAARVELASEITSSYRIVTRSDTNKSYISVQNSSQDLLSLFDNNRYRIRKLFDLDNYYYEEFNKQKLNALIYSNPVLAKKFPLTNDIKEIMNIIKGQSYENREDFESKHICLKKKWLDTETFEVIDPECIHPNEPTDSDQSYLLNEEIVTTTLDIEYDEEAECPNFLEFLETILPDEEDRKLIQEMFAACLIQDNWYEKAFLLHGNAANGKTTLLEILEYFLGNENTSNKQLQELTNYKFSLQNIHDCLANIAADISDQEITDNAYLKAIVSGDTLQAPLKNKNRTLTFKPKATLIFSCNDLPPVKNIDDAWVRRWKMIKFPVIFKPKHAYVEGDYENDEMVKIKKKRNKILDPIEEEMAGILNWIIEGGKRLIQEEKFTRNEYSREVKEFWITHTDSIRAFINERIKRKKDNVISRSDLYDFYRSYCQNRGIESESQRKFTREIKRQTSAQTCTPKVRGKRQRSWKGIGYVEE